MIKLMILVVSLVGQVVAVGGRPYPGRSASWRDRSTEGIGVTGVASANTGGARNNMSFFSSAPKQSNENFELVDPLTVRGVLPAMQWTNVGWWRRQ
jgi:hypothetical protein